MRHALPNGTVLVLITNVLDTGITSEDFAALYRGRWRIEECFKLIKAGLQVECWSGILPHSVEQDYYASLLRANCAAALALEADPGHACLYPPAPDDKGWRRTLNCTLAIKSLRHALPRLLLNVDFEDLLVRLIARLRRPGAKELTRADRQAPHPQHDRVRLAGFHLRTRTLNLMVLALSWRSRMAKNGLQIAFPSFCCIAELHQQNREKLQQIEGGKSGTALTFGEYREPSTYVTQKLPAG